MLRWSTSLHPSIPQVDNALTHELIHAYDHCRAASLDWASLEHHACSEIRAASLSGGAAGGAHWAARGATKAS